MTTKPAETFPDVEELSLAALDEKSHFYSWSDAPELWRSLEVETCSECGATLVIGAGGERLHSDEDSAVKCAGYVNAEGPMMNFYYPLPNLDYALRTRFGDDASRALDAEQRLGAEDAGLHAATRTLASLPLALIEFTDANHDDDNKHALALTGGGMDLSWEICEAYMRLGYAPPVFFDPPLMSGRGKAPVDLWILAGCRRARLASIKCAQRALERLDERFPPPAAPKRAKRGDSPGALPR